VNRALLLSLVVGAAGWMALWFSTDARAGWSFDLRPEQGRWGLRYRMRPAYPAWVSVHTGLALLVVLGAVRWRARLLEVADRLTRAEDRIPLA